MLARMQPTIAHISIHALREEGDVLTSIKDNHPRIFLSTPSARRATAECHAWKADLQISIHALREEGDPRTADSGSTGNDFYPRPPRGGRQDGGDYLLTGKLFLSTPSARRATVVVDERDLREVISIHALREEGDM